MKKSYSIVIVLAVLAILIGTYSYIKLNPKQEEVEQTTTEEKVVIAKFDSASIVKIELVSDERELVITKESDLWILNGRNDIKASQNLINSMMTLLSDIKADMIIEENAADLTIYGLDKPKKAVVTLADGKSYTILMGNSAPTGEGYYFMKDGEKSVYMLSNTYKNTFSYKFEDLVEKEEIPSITPENLNYVYIAQKGRPEIELIRIEQNETAPVEMWNTMATWKMVKPYADVRNLLAEDVWTKLLTGMTAFNASVKGFIANNPTDLSIYGLDNPELELWFKDTENIETHLYFGRPTEDGSIYFKQADSINVYTINSLAVDVFKNVNAFEIVDKFAMLLNIEDVNKVVINKDGQSTTFDVTVTKEKAEGSDKETAVIGCKVDGKEYPEDDFKKLYQNFIGIMIDSEYKGEKLTGTPDISIAIHTSDGRVTESKYYRYDDQYYVFDKNGIQEFLVAKRKLDNLSVRMTDFFNGTIINN